MKTKFTLWTLCLLFTTIVTAQQRDCATMPNLEYRSQQDPKLEKRMLQIESFTQSKIQESQSKLADGEIITIPVVVHVVYNTSAENISEAQIQSQIDVLNEDFRRLNADASNTPNDFTGVASDIEIEFCLASVDPDGNATNGITRTSTSLTSFGTNDQVKFASSGGKDAWPASDYLNVWVCDISGGILGYAQFPGGSASTDGVVNDYAYFGTIGTATAPFNLGRTMTHEVGHYLNLRHIWGDGPCSADDFVSDTPQAGGANYTGSPCTYPGPNSCDSGLNDLPDMFQNYMDYSDDGCMNLFTTGQKARMRALFESGGFRESLLNSTACGNTCDLPAPTGIESSNIVDNSFTVSWNGVSGAVNYLVSVNGTSNVVSGTNYNATGLIPGTEYTVTIKANCSDGGSGTSSSLIVTTTGTAPVSYCDSASTNIMDEYIGRVQLNTIDNVSGGQFYTDFTNISTTLTQGLQYTITVTPTWTGTVYPEGYAVWIDFNQDGDFTDSGELVWSQSITTSSPVSGTFTIPQNTIQNATRMRVSMKYNGVPTSCETFQYGEVEDYTVILQSTGPDTTPPIITLTGDSNINLEQGDTYNEQGATATDNVDGNITENIIIGGDTVNTNIIGVYNVLYNVNDAAGNSAAEVTRIVTVFQASPTCNDGIQNGDETGIDCGGSTCEPCELPPSCDDGIQNGDETGIDCGGSTCEPCNTGGTVIISEGYFETGWDNWEDGGSDCARYSGSFSTEGSFSIRLRDNSGIASSMSLNNLDLSSYTKVTVNFSFYANSMENGEDFWLQYDDGSGFTTIATYARGTSFPGNGAYTTSVELLSENYNFANSVGFRFRCDASGNNDQIYIDEVVITGELDGPDSTPPIITLIGDSTINLGLNGVYTEQGATATDNIDGDISNNISITGSVITSTPGTYFVAYNVSDSAGNAATTVIRTVNVIQDTTPPVIELIGSSEVSVNQGDTYTDAGATAQDNIDGDVTSNIVVDNPVNTSTIGSYSVTYNVSDAAGNAANTVTRTVVVVDAPTGPDILNEGYFETGLDGWADGGSDCARVFNAGYAFEGDYSVRIRDNSGVASSMTLSSIDLTPYAQVEVDFYFYVRSMENGEDFWLRYFNGSSWATVATWTRGNGIENNSFYNATITLSAANINFASNSGFRFQNDASGNNDQIYIDQVVIRGFTGNARLTEDKIEKVGYFESSKTSELDILIYPNPVKGNILNVELQGVKIFSYSIIDMVGKKIIEGESEGQINVSKLSGGLYFIKVSDGDEIITKKFIKN